MNFQQARWIAEQLNELTWTIAQYRVWVIVLITLAGVVMPLLKARRGGKPLPTPSMCIHSGGATLAFTNLTGHPSLIARCGMIGDKPLSIEFIGQLYREDLILRVGHAMEQAVSPRSKWPEVESLPEPKE